jgi:hypothetical protein
MSRRKPRTPVLPGPESSPGPRPKPGARAGATVEPPAPAPGPELDHDAEVALWLGERLRRVALGATAALIVSRALWPGEPDFRYDAGTGLAWVLALLVVAGLALASGLIGGTFRVRWSWADAAVITLVALVALSAGHAVDRRPAINLAWEWAALGVAYLLVRNLPRTRGESTALAGALAATAVAVAAYGLWQAAVEIPELQRAFLANPAAKLKILNIEPGTPGEALIRSRLLGSNEPFSTFGLANSLAGFLVGPLVVMLAVAWDNLTRRDDRGSRWLALALAVPPVLVVLYCLTLTKSRSAYLGLLAGLLVLAWRERRRVRARTLAIAGAAALVVVAGLVAAGLATGRLDRLVVTESGKSLRFRRDYWVGAWAVINETPRAFWYGHGPGNFSAPYVRHKLPTASEDIHDPHNFVLEVWAAAGFWAVVALAAALVLIFWNLFGPSHHAQDEAREVEASTEPPPRGSRARARDPSAPPAGVGWLVACGGLGLVAAFPPVGTLNPFEGDLFFRWLILAAAWVLAVGCGHLLWRGRPLDASALGAAVLAVLVNLVAAGGIGVPAVALGLWTAAALGLNLREGRPCGAPREAPWWLAVVGDLTIVVLLVGATERGNPWSAGALAVWGVVSLLAVSLIVFGLRSERAGPLVPLVKGRLIAFVIAVNWVALLGFFVGSVRPFWQMQAALAAADEALAQSPPRYERAEALRDQATRADRFSARPWQMLAALEYEIWRFRGAKHDDLRWKKIPVLLYKAVSAPRPPDVWTRHRERAVMSGLILKQIGDKLKPLEAMQLRGAIVEADRRAVLLYPTNASLHARLAEASADIGMTPDAVKEGREALRLDELTPHEDRKLDASVRQWLQSRLPAWEKATSEAQSIATPKPKTPRPSK